jgi:polyketide synthase 12
LAAPQNGAHGSSDRREDDLRQALQSIPLARLERAGVLDVLLDLAGVEGESPAGVGSDRIDEIAEMDLSELVKVSLEPSTDGESS